VIKVVEDSMLEFKEYSIKIRIRRVDFDGLRKMNAAGQRFGFADGSVRSRDSHRCHVAHGVGIAARVG